MKQTTIVETTGPDGACSNLDRERGRDNLEGANAGVCITQLAELPGKTLLDAKALSRHLSVSTRTLHRMVTRGQLPRGIRLGGRPMWIVETVLEYLGAEADKQAAEAKRTAARFSFTGR